MTDRQSIINLEYQTALRDLERAEAKLAPSYMMRPTIYPDGDMWCALYGMNLQEGVAGFGETPELACADFDKNWRGQKLNPTTTKEDT